MPPMALSLWSRGCDGDENSSSCEKPVNNFTKSGIPAIIAGILFLGAAGVCCYFLYRNKKRDAEEAKADQKWHQSDL